ncbi:MAG TPA: efflux RND transporter permease subunit [Pseudomonadota bacterium]|nr:efflux RND transporter permease subunit [Pseudomonadota bacterium]
MIRSIITLAARHKYLVVLLCAAAVALAVRSLRDIPLDAIPDLSDTQVIVYSRWDRSPTLLEDQVTYPIVTSLLGAPRVKAVRGLSDFGYSYVYVLFEDGTDIYWARSRVLEYLAKVQSRLPPEVRTELGPDASGVGWVFQYALVDDSGLHRPDELRSYQDWFLRYALQSVPGVAEVATLGGALKQYQVTIEPNRLAAHGLGIRDVTAALRKSNSEVGGRLIELSGREFMVRGRGYIKEPADIAQVVLSTDGKGVPLRIKDLGQVTVGPELRRGVADLDGRGEVTGGIVVMRHGENALNVIARVKDRLQQLAPSLPAGVRVVTTYDRSELIGRAIDTVRSKLVEEIAIVALVILVFLWHIPSAIVPIVTIPVAVLLAFIPMQLLGVSVNIMSLSGIAISIGVLVDGAIVEVENAYKKLQLWEAGGRQGDFHNVRLQALLEVGPSVFFSLLVIAVAFLPIFALVEQEGRLFHPLALSKNLAMALAALLAITLDPAMRMIFTRMEPLRFAPRPLAWLTNQLVVGKYYPEERHPISRILFWLYEPVCRAVLRRPLWTLAGAAVLVATTVPVYQRLGSEFMPPLYEGSLLYMPTSLPGMSVTEAARLLTQQDRILRGFPEVQTVFGKAGRAETSTDPAPLSMMETTLVLKPESQWRRRERFYSRWAPPWLATLLRSAWPDHITHDELVSELDQALRIPGTTNAWTMPIKARIDMLSTGVRTPIGIKIFGSDPRELERLGTRIEAALRPLPGTRSVFAERAAGGYFLDFELRRDALARYGLLVQDANEVIAAAIGGEAVTTTIEGRERYTINVRYPRELRQDPEQLGRALVPTPDGTQVALRQLADIHLTTGPAMIRDENGLLAAYVYVDFDSQKLDIGQYVAQAKAAVAAQLGPTPGYTLLWSGQFENLLRVRERLQTVLPLTLLILFLLLYLNTRSALRATLVLLAVPFSAIGAVWILYLLGYNVSVAVWVGVIALMGLDAETGVFMLLYLDLAYDEAQAGGRLRHRGELKEAIVDGAVKRVRPKAMTVCAALMGLLPILWAAGAGADVMKRIAAPMIGGLVTSFALELVVYPVIYLLWRQRGLPAAPADDELAEPPMD